mgnify:CR=1 FL=1
MTRTIGAFDRDCPIKGLCAHERFVPYEESGNAKEVGPESSEVFIYINPFTPLKKAARGR